MIILGAGLAGCIAGHLFPGSLLLERGKREEVGAHKALLRFRSDAISRITGIPFRKVQVHKAVVYGSDYWDGGRDVPIVLQNMYSRKVTGTLSSRSIWNLEAVTRYVAPEDFHERMVKQLEVLFDWDVDIVSGLLVNGHRKNAGSLGVHCGYEREPNDALLSTLPLPVMLGLAQIERHLVDEKTFVRQPIDVQRWKVKNCDLFQTIYFPDPSYPIYRASITGDTLIVESMHSGATTNLRMVMEVLTAFGLTWDDTESIGTVNKQEYGKILPLADDARHHILMELTRLHRVYSLGRFATWRNVLLDDLPQDADRIRELIGMSEYRKTLTGAK